MQVVDVETKLESYRRSYRRGTDWMLGCFNADGSLGNVTERNYYYRVPWALALMGETEAAHRLLDWVDRNRITAEGSLDESATSAGPQRRYGSYPLACLIYGASLLGRLDLVRRCTGSLLSWQDPETGGFFANAPEGVEGDQELFPTAQAAMTLSLVGRIPEAVEAGLWLQRLWELQPDPEHRLYAVYRRSQGLVRDYDPAEAAFYVTLKDEPWQHHFNGGIAAAGLLHIHEATGEDRWLRLAREYERFSMSTKDIQFRSKQVCKSGWGSGLLYVATREEAYRAWTLRMGDWFVEHQFGDGHWENTKFWTPDPTLGDKIMITAEFVMHLANIIAYLSVSPEP